MNCKYCKLEENKQSSPCLSCKECNDLIHLDCLQRKTPGGFAGDTFFVFTCKECSPSREEIFDRGKMSWFLCLVIVLYDLKTKCGPISNQGYFHWRTHIGTFITKNWNCLFHPQFKQKKNWAGTFSGTLSQYSPIFFKSGSEELNQSGWWKLTHALSPTLIKYISSEMIVQKQNEKAVKSEYPQLNKELDCSIFLQLINTLEYTHLLSLESIDSVSNETAQSQIKTETPSSQSDAFDDIDDNNYTYKNEFETSAMTNYLSNYFPDGEEESLSDFDSLPPDFEEFPESCFNTNSHNNSSNHNTDVNEIGSNYLSSGETYDSDNTNHSNHYNQFIKSEEHSEDSNDSKMETFDQPRKRMKLTQSVAEVPAVKSLFSDASRTKETDLPWLEDYRRKDSTNKESLIVVTEYEEAEMLNYLNNVCRKNQFNLDKKFIRLRAKLALRKLKRNKHIFPEWNIDSLTCQLSKFPVQDYIRVCSQQSIRVLDRYQQITENLSGTTMSLNVNFATRLTGTAEMTPFLSPYSGRLLKPYIRRDFTTVSPWTKLMRELVTKVHNGKRPLTNAPLDYCYVRPQFIPSINSLCEQYFWPGIDLTETLQYPDFSCVVLYKKLIVGFAFLVPDVGHNEAYISFIFTRPQWRRSGIAKFMLYHLIQTCIQKDITLHVSATNSAALLYQKFGFKIEELVQDFYDKYFPPDSTECKHALFLRLSR